MRHATADRTPEADAPRIGANGRRALLAAVVGGALLALAGCNWDVDPLASLGASLKKVCRSSDSCATHDTDPGRRY